MSPRADEDRLHELDERLGGSWHWRDAYRHVAEAPTLGGPVTRWIESLLIHGEGDFAGDPFVLDQWQREIVFYLYAYRIVWGDRDPDVDDPVAVERIFDELVLEGPKGIGKTPFAAALEAAELLGPTVPTWDPKTRTVVGKARRSPVGVTAAASYEQANLLHGTLGAMVGAALARYVDVYDREIRIKRGGGYAKRVAARAGTNDGARPTFWCADEFHEWLSDEHVRTATKLANNARKRDFCLTMKLSTPGFDPSSLMGKLHARGVRIHTGEIDPGSTLYVLFSATAPHVKPEAWDLSDPECLRAGLRRAYPSTWINVERLALAWEDPLPDEALDEPTYRRYFGGQWVAAATMWLPTGAWSALVVVDKRPRKGADVCLGFDGSYNRDSTALIGATVASPIHVFVVDVWERPDDAPDGWTVDREAVKTAVAKAMRRYNVISLACDPSGWHDEVDQWGELYGFGPDEGPVIEAPPTRARMIPACSRFYSKVVVDGGSGELITHDGNPTLARHLHNCAIRETPNGAFIVKESRNSPRKIDAAVGAVIAVDEAATVIEDEPGGMLI